MKQNINAATWYKIFGLGEISTRVTYALMSLGVPYDNLFDGTVKDEDALIITGFLNHDSFRLNIVEAIDKLKDKEKRIIVVGAMPFSFEGRKNKAIALETINTIKDKSVECIIFQSDKIRQLLGNISIEDAFFRAGQAAAALILQTLISIQGPETKKGPKPLLP